MNNATRFINVRRWTVITAEGYSYRCTYGRYRLRISAWLMARKFIKTGHPVKIGRCRRGEL